MRGPMLACSLKEVDLARLHYPVLPSPKLDGIRCIIEDGGALSRKLKLIPNRHVQSWVKQHAHQLNRLDGELIVGAVTGGHVFERTQSGIMAVDGSTEFSFHVFDVMLEGDINYTQRMRTIPKKLPKNVHIVEQVLCHDLEELLAYEQECLAKGYEGIMVRDPLGLYKFGRSTFKEHYLLKFKRFLDTEGVVIECVEMNHNTNEQKRDALGNAKRSGAKAGMKKSGLLGKLVLRSKKFKEPVHIGAGVPHLPMDEAKKLFMGKMAKFKYQEVGKDGAPRFPVYLGIRSKEDM